MTGPTLPFDYRPHVGMIRSLCKWGVRAQRGRRLGFREHPCLSVLPKPCPLTSLASQPQLLEQIGTHRTMTAHTDRVGTHLSSDTSGRRNSALPLGPRDAGYMLLGTCQGRTDKDTTQSPPATFTSRQRPWPTTWTASQASEEPWKNSGGWGGDCPFPAKPGAGLTLSMLSVGLTSPHCKKLPCYYYLPYTGEEPRAPLMQPAWFSGAR